MKMKIKVGDEIVVLRGKDRGRRGKVERVLRREGKVLVPGLNIYKRHRKSRGKAGTGEIVELPRPFDVGKVAVWCKTCGKGARIGLVMGEGGKKERVCRRCKGVMGS